jgi:hypothetical protein
LLDIVVLTSEIRRCFLAYYHLPFFNKTVPFFLEMFPSKGLEKMWRGKKEINGTNEKRD